MKNKDNLSQFAKKSGFAKLDQNIDNSIIEDQVKIVFNLAAPRF